MDSSTLNEFSVDREPVLSLSTAETAPETVWQSDSAFRSLIERAWDGITVLAADGRILYASPSMCRILGHSPDEAPGHSAFEIIHPDDMPAAIAVLGELLKSPGASIAVDLRHRHSDGSWRWLRGTATNLLDEPAVRGIVCNYRDVTERRAAQDALRESEERLRLGLDAGNTGTWDWDIVNNRVAWSERIFEFHGVAPADFGGKVEDFAKLVHPDDDEHVKAAIRESLENRKPYQVEFRVRHADGTIRWLTTSGRVYHDAAGRPIRMLGATSDITERKLAEQERDRLLASERAARAEAERNSRLKDEFLATLGHELRTPLNAILGWAQLLRTGKMNPAELSDGLAVIERNARVQARLIEDLLDVSRIISGKVRLDVQRLALATVIESAVEAVRPAADAKGIALRLALDAQAAVMGDASRLTQVLFNLMSNAIKYTPRGGQVQVVLSEVAGHVEVCVADNGEGIDLAFLPHVFDRFRQADGSTTRKHGGLGLGLAITKSLIELHGGTVRVTSDGPGCGSTFTVSLPPAPPASVPVSGAPDVARSSNAASHAAIGDVSLAGVRVLVVDDEADARAMVQRLLEEHEAIVTTATSAAEAIEIVRREKPQVLVSDIGMPGEDGYVLIRKIRALGPDQGGDVPAVALTAYARSEDRTRAMLAGYQTHIAKPLEATELLATVASLAGRVV